MDQVGDKLENKRSKKFDGNSHLLEEHVEDFLRNQGKIHLFFGYSENINANFN